MKAAISSCRAWTNSILSSARFERAEHAVDAVAGIAEDDPHAPGVQPLDHEIGDCPGHRVFPLGLRRQRARQRATALRQRLEQAPVPGTAGTAARFRLMLWDVSRDAAAMPDLRRRSCAHGGDADRRARRERSRRCWPPCG